MTIIGQMKKQISWIIQFVFIQANSCIFGISLLLLIVLTAQFYPQQSAFSRIDFLSISAILIQILFVIFKVEALKESIMIFIFHFLGMGMEVFKTKVGSWHYPNNGYLFIAMVPIFTGFMYASVGSYILRMQRNFRCTFTAYPHYSWVILLGTLVYINFISHHYMVDLRWWLVVSSIVIFRKTRVTLYFSTGKMTIPYLSVLLSIGLLLWVAENIGSFYAIWRYPHQQDVWHWVSPQKIIAWYLLTFTLLAVIDSLFPLRQPLQGAAYSGDYFTDNINKLKG